MRGTRLWLVLGLALLATALVAAGCGGDDDEDGGEFGLISEGTLTVGSDIPFAPFEQGRAGNYTGFDIELVNEIAERLDLEVEIVDTKFGTIVQDLARGKFDMVASATTITGEREQEVDFSNPYYLAGQSLVVQEGSDVDSVEKLSGLTVGAQDGTTGLDYAKDETDSKTVRSYEVYDDAFNALVAGQLDAVVADIPAAESAVERKKGLEISTEIETGEEYGLMFQQDADDLREAVNEAVQELKDDGIYADLYEEWIGGEAPEEILDATHEPS